MGARWARRMGGGSAGRVGARWLRHSKGTHDAPVGEPGVTSNHLQHRIVAAVLGVVGGLGSLVGYLLVRHPAAVEATGASPGALVVITGFAFTALAVVAVRHYGRRALQLTTAYHELHRATLQRERSEAALRESERFVRAALDAMDAELAVLDADGVIMAVNRAWRAATEVHAGGSGTCDVGVNYLAVCDGTPLGQGLRELMAGTRDTFVLETQLPGRECRTLTRASRFPGNGPRRVVVVHDDVTPLRQASENAAPVREDAVALAAAAEFERRRLEQALRIAQDAITITPAAIAWLAADGRLVRVNHAWCALYGYAEDRLLEMTVADLAPDRSAEWWEGAWARARAGASLPQETMHRRQDGRPLPVELVVTVHALDGQECGIVVARDLSDRHETAARFDAERLALVRVGAEADRLRTLAAHASSGLLLLDATGACVYANRAWTVLSGQSDGDSVGGGWLQAVHPDDAPRVRAEWRELLRQPSPWETELRVRSHDGMERWLRAQADAVVADDGSPSGFVLTLVDVTPQKVADEEARARNAELEQRLVADVGHAEAELRESTMALQQRAEERRQIDAELQRTAETLEAERRRATARAADLHEALTERSAALARANGELETLADLIERDLRAPLRAIDDDARVVTEGYSDRIDPDGRRHLSAIRENAHRMGDVLDTLHDLSQPGRRTLDLAPVDMTALARAVAAELESAAGERRVAVNVATMTHVTGDVTLLRQLLGRLIVNAVTSTRTAQHPCIDIGSVDRDGVPVFYVRDNGVGFDMHAADERFPGVARLPDATEGEGVGLAIARRIVERHAGRFWAEGRVNEGATFFFTLGVGTERGDGVPTLALEPRSVGDSQAWEGGPAASGLTHRSSS